MSFQKVVSAPLEFDIEKGSNGTFRGVLRGRLTPRIYDIFQALPGRKRHKDGVLFFEWSNANVEFLSLKLPEVRWSDAAEEKRRDIVRLREIERERRATKDRPLPPEASAFPFKTTPFEHQLRAFHFSKDITNFGLFMEMGCVDADTEYLSPLGWKKISEYEQGQVAQFNLNGTVEFVEPSHYLVKPCDTMYRYHHDYGCDQKLSSDHRMLLSVAYKPTRKTPNDGWCEYVEKEEDGRWLVETTPRKLQERFSGARRPKATVPCRFIHDGPGSHLSDAEIRVMVAFIADGSYGTKSFDCPPKETRKGYINVKKERKKERLRMLLKAAGIAFVEKQKPSGFSGFEFIPPSPEKHFVLEHWWQTTARQKTIISEECLLWDGDGKAFFSVRKEDADFIQFCFCGSGRRCRVAQYNGLYQVMPTERPLYLQTVGVEEKTVDGKMYCFSVPSTYLLFRRNGCVFVSGNTGKTKVLIDTAAYLFSQGGEEGPIDCLVVVAPNGVHSQWVVEQVPQHMPDFVPWKGAYFESSPNAVGRERMAEVMEYSDGLKVIAIHVEGLSSAKGESFLRTVLLKNRCMLVVDESSRIKNPSAKRTKALVAMAPLAKYRRIATGTPVTQGVEDIYAQFQFLDSDILGHNSFYSFQHHYCVTQKMNFGARNVTKTVGYQNLEELTDRIEGHTFRVRKEDCLDLPDKLFVNEIVELTPSQRENYQQLKKELYVQLEGGEILTASLAITNLMRLQQILAGFLPSPETGKPVRLETNRTQSALNIVLASTSKVVIWTKFREEVEMLKEAFDKEGIKYVTYTGDTEQRTRVDVVDRFRSDPDIKVFITNPQCAGTGLNLVEASTVIWTTATFSLESWLQANDRCHRIGQANKVTYYLLQSPNSVDQKIYKALQNKQNIADMVVDRNLLKGLLGA